MNGRRHFQRQNVRLVTGDHSDGVTAQKIARANAKLDGSGTTFKLLRLAWIDSTTSPAGSEPNAKTSILSVRYKSSSFQLLGSSRSLKDSTTPSSPTRIN